MNDGRERPTRTDLLRVLSHLQDVIGRAKSLHHNDRVQHAHAHTAELLEHAFDVCIEAQGHDRPVQQRSRKGWEFPEPDEITRNII